MSYPISGLNTGYHHPGYKVSKPLVPHGVSVILSAPAVFRFTGASNPERHLQAAEILGAWQARGRVGVALALGV